MTVAASATLLMDSAWLLVTVTVARLVALRADESVMMALLTNAVPLAMGEFGRRAVIVIVSVVRHFCDGIAGAWQLRYRFPQFPKQRCSVLYRWSWGR